MENFLGLTGPFMVVAAHPDDAEIQCGGTVARLIGEGQEVIYVICTNGNRGSHPSARSKEELAEIRKAEQREAAEALGVRQVHFLDYDDGDLCFHQPELRERLVELLRRHRPGTVFAHDPFAGRSTYDVCSLHPDHRVAGEVAFDACFFCSDGPLYYPEQLLRGLRPHQVSTVLLFMTENPDLYVDIGGTFQAKVSAIAKHGSQWGGHDLEGFFGGMAEDTGRAKGIPLAEAFKLLKR